MNYEHKSSINRKRFGLSLKISIIFILLILFLHFLFPAFLSNILLTLIKPFWTINNDKYCEDISMNSQIILINELRKENEELKGLMNRIGDKDFVLAYIIKKPPFTVYDSYIIDIGEDKGIKKGDNVYAVGDILIGTIEEVYNNTSKVKLFSSFGEKYDILIGDKNIQAIAIGKGGGSFEALIPRDIKINEGDIIKIPNIINPTFAVVNKIMSDPARTFSIVLFSQPLNIYEQKWVKVYAK